jgi:hypothetical protein
MRRVVRDDLAELILACLEPEEEDRPADMEVLARALRRIARKERASRADVEFLARTALQNRQDKTLAKGAQAPLRPAPAPRAPLAPAGAPWTAAPAAPPPEPPAPRVDPLPSRPPRSAARPPATPLPVVELPPAPPPEAWDRADSTAWDRDFGSGSIRASRADDLSVKRRAARGEVSLLSWLALILFGLAVIFFGVSASLTGSPLGLLEVLVPLP